MFPWRISWKEVAGEETIRSYARKVIWWRTGFAGIYRGRCGIFPDCGLKVK